MTDENRGGESLIRLDRATELSGLSKGEISALVGRGEIRAWRIPRRARIVGQSSILVASRDLAAAAVRAGR